jgi:two-component system KDP operon response regulator KdpE
MVMKHSKTLLVIEDEPAIIRFLRSSVSPTGWHILEAMTKESGLQLAAAHRPDVILLDLALPEGGALGLLKALRQWTSAPIILMGSRDQENEQVAGIEAGAHDFLMKPFSSQELIARLRMALRHRETQFEDMPLYEYLGLRVDLVTRRIYLRNKEIHLSPMQYEFLSQLVRHAGRVVTHQELLESVWGGRQNVTTDHMRVFVFDIRRKIEANPSKPQLLKTEPGVGYRLEAPVGASSAGGAASSENGRRRYRLESSVRAVKFPSPVITQALTAH